MVSRHAKKRAEKRAREAGHDVEQRLQEPLAAEFEGIPSANLFYEDKAGTLTNKTSKPLKHSDAEQPARKQRKVLKSTAILSAGRAANVLPKPEKRKKKKALSHTPGHQLKTQQLEAATRGMVQARDDSEQAQLDLWGDSMSHSPLGPRRRLKANPTQGSGPVAVEVDQPGCSYNPDAEQHQDAIAAAVAAEVRKTIASELMPKAPPRFSNEAAGHISELDMLQVDDDSSVHEEEGAEETPVAVIDRRPPQQKTATQRNREARRKATDTDLMKRKQRKALGKDILRAPDLVAEIEAEVAEQQFSAQRRKADLAEKRAVEPPRLGKQLYEPASVQVLLSEELQGSLRTLKGSPTLARDRYKSLQQRGIIEPRSRAQFKPGRKLVVQDQFSSR